MLVVKAGEGVPVDGVVLEGAGTVDESVITGESVPVEKAPGDAVTGATINRTGWFAMRAERVGADTTLGGHHPPCRRSDELEGADREDGRQDLAACSCRR